MTAPVPSLNQTSPPRIETNSDHRVVLHSVGSADAAVLGVVKQVAPGPLEDIAALVYRAPSELLAGVEREFGEQVVELLNQTGLIAAVEPNEQPPPASKGVLDVALVVGDYRRLPELTASIAGFLGCGLTEAQRIACASPAVLIGAVSEATVGALRARLEPLGAQVIASEANAAVYDLIVTGISEQALRRILAASGARDEFCFVPGPEREAWAMAGLRIDHCREISENLRRSGATASVCSRTFERYDLRLDAVSSLPGVARVLTEELRVRADLVERVIQRVPLFICQDLEHDEAMRLLGVFEAAGTRASAHPQSLQRFAVKVTAPGDPRAAREVILALAPEGTRGSSLRAGELAAWGLTKTLAHWLKCELGKAGTQTAVELS